LPAPAGHGITFQRSDRPGHGEIRAHIDHVVDTTLATTLGTGVNGARTTIGTVEHLLAALTGVGIDNARVLVDGPEIPVFDGSAAPFVDMLLEGGIEVLPQSKRYMVIRRDVTVRDGDKVAQAKPGSSFSITCSVDFDHPLIDRRALTFEFSERGFHRSIAPARTFGFAKDVEALQARGLARGGSLDNAVVIDGYRILNEEGLRFADEFVRHKLLDSLGDLALTGMAMVGKLRFHRSGHALNTALVRAIMADPANYHVVEPARGRDNARAQAYLQPVPFDI
jgi:UDP-3-O-[3-hydroxymyristoyl] N-acetylglucosamine deacetylase